MVQNSRWGYMREHHACVQKRQLIIVLVHCVPAAVVVPVLLGVCKDGAEQADHAAHPPVLLQRQGTSGSAQLDCAKSSTHGSFITLKGGKVGVLLQAPVHSQHLHTERSRSRSRALHSPHFTPPFPTALAAPPVPPLPHKSLPSLAPHPCSLPSTPPLP